MDLINDFICHCPLGKHQVLGTCLQKYHAINFLYIVPGEHSQCVHRIHLHTDLFVSFSSFKKTKKTMFVQGMLPIIAKTRIMLP